MPCQSVAGLHQWQILSRFQIRRTQPRARCSARRRALATAHELRDEDDSCAHPQRLRTGHQIVMISSRHGLFRLDLPFRTTFQYTLVLGLDLLGELLRKFRPRLARAGRRSGASNSSGGGGCPQTAREKYLYRPSAIDPSPETVAKNRHRRLARNRTSSPATPKLGQQQRADVSRSDVATVRRFSQTLKPASRGPPCKSPHPHPYTIQLDGGGFDGQRDRASAQRATARRSRSISAMSTSAISTSWCRKASTPTARTSSGRRSEISSTAKPKRSSSPSRDNNSISVCVSTAGRIWRPCKRPARRFTSRFSG